MEKPNIFKYATKELSQDAFIFWLLDHANPKYKNIDLRIKNCALELLSSFFELENKSIPEKITHFELSKQIDGIDILLKINKYYLVIEDKTYTKSHSNQLRRYRDIALKKANNISEHVLSIYFKTHDQSDYSKEISDGFKIFTRDKLISILNRYNNIESDIFNDFKDHINLIENDVNAFITKEIWDHKNWIGFFKYLQKEMNRGGWDYVSNPKKGFMGYWWAFQKNEICWQYLQLQEAELVLKINARGSSKYRQYRDFCYNHFFKFSKIENLSFKKPQRFGAGNTITILKTEYIIRNPETKLVDLNATVENLKRYTRFIEKYALNDKDFLSLR